jgi:hypothetical protein
MRPSFSKDPLLGWIRGTVDMPDILRSIDHGRRAAARLINSRCVHGCGMIDAH